jgi:hypothetical protein
MACEPRHWRIPPKYKCWKIELYFPAVIFQRLKEISSSIIATVVGMRAWIKPSDDFIGKRYSRLGVGKEGGVGVDFCDAENNLHKTISWKVIGNGLSITSQTDQLHPEERRSRLVMKKSAL